MLVGRERQLKYRLYPHLRVRSIEGDEIAEQPRDSAASLAEECLAVIKDTHWQDGSADAEGEAGPQ